MIVTDLPISGAFLVASEALSDHRGYFARLYCRREFHEAGLPPLESQCSLSFTHEKGALRGLHWQTPPFAETKLVRCFQGAVYDVILDLRPESPTYRRWHAVVLSEDNLLGVVIPERVAHGFQTLAERTLVHYMMSGSHHPEASRGVRFDDPAFGISWPLPVTLIAERDRTYPDFDPRITDPLDGGLEDLDR